MKSAHILLVEDNPGDVSLVRAALDEAKLANELHVASSGDEAVAYLGKAGTSPEHPVPDLILLDLNLPGMSGKEVLRVVRSTAATSTTPVVVMTSSEAERDIVESYELHANCFVTKPLDFEKFVAIVQQVEEFWLTVVKLPRRAGR